MRPTITIHPGKSENNTHSAKRPSGGKSQTDKSLQTESWGVFRARSTDSDYSRSTRVLAVKSTNPVRRRTTSVAGAKLSDRVSKPNLPIRISEQPQPVTIHATDRSAPYRELPLNGKGSRDIVVVLWDESGKVLGFRGCAGAKRFSTLSLKKRGRWSAVVRIYACDMGSVELLRECWRVSVARLRT